MALTVLDSYQYYSEYSSLPAEARVGGGDHDGVELDDGKTDGSNHEGPSVDRVETSTNREGVAEIAAEQSITSVETITETPRDRHRWSSTGTDETSDDCGDDDREYSSVELEQQEISTGNGCSVDGGAADDDEYIIGESEHPTLRRAK
ncbi:hypothetical protein MHU86_916 [Fragilaria crotonensis]|nr:hypothetical protein MHU86_916 [Fragilaria crotonensis]